jgi:hypothetical protein
VRPTSAEMIIADSPRRVGRGGDDGSARSGKPASSIVLIFETLQRAGMGKRGGGRVIYYVALGTDRFYMMVAYPKSERDDLSREQRRRILGVLESIKR